MFKILEAEQLSANVYKQVILAPRVAKSCEPGQFIILRVDENGERIPLTICDYDEKAGTVTMDVTKAVNEIKAGKIEYRLDKTNIIHVPVGKASFTEEQLADNFQTLMDAINKVRPAAVKGQYLKSVTLTSTMGPGVKVNPMKLA